MLTRDGLRAVFRADHDGLQARISHIAFGDGGYAPTGAETALHNEHIRVPVAGGAWVGDFTIHMTALLDDGPSFWVREVGIVLSDGTLLAVWSHATTPLVYKTAGVPIVTAFDLSLEALPASAVTVAAGDIDLTLFFGAEFARLGAAVLGNSSRILAQSERVAALEGLPGALAAHTAMIGRIEAAGRQLDTRADELLSLAAQLGMALLGDAGRLQAQGERVNALEGLPGAVAALTAMIGRIETAGRRLDIRFGEVEKQLPLRGIQSYQARGSYGFIVPAGVWKVHGRLVGGGGGAAGVGQLGDGSARPGGAGGGGGAAEGWLEVTPGQVIAITVGAGGAGGAASANVAGAAGANGGSGGTSSIGAFMAATGGGGGGSVSSAGAGGGTGTGGAVNYTGGVGGDGSGSVGSASYGGQGGVSLFGGGGRAAMSYAAVVCDGKAPGSGGGSVYAVWAAAGKGGNGADGAVILQW